MRVEALQVTRSRETHSDFVRTQCHTLESYKNQLACFQSTAHRCFPRKTTGVDKREKGMEKAKKGENGRNAAFCVCPCPCFQLFKPSLGAVQVFLFPLLHSAPVETGLLHTHKTSHLTLNHLASRVTSPGLCSGKTPVGFYDSPSRPCGYPRCQEGLIFAFYSSVPSLWKRGVGTLPFPSGFCFTSPVVVCIGMALTGS